MIQQGVKILNGCAKNFHPADETNDVCIRQPRETLSQTDCNANLNINATLPIQFRDNKYTELDRKIQILEQTFKDHSELILRIQKLALQMQKQSSIINNSLNINNNNGSNNTANIFKILNSNKSTQLSPRIVNNTQQDSLCSAESVKYRIIADSTENINDEPTDIKLAEYLNSSGDSDRLQICLTPEENNEMETCENGNISISTTQQSNFSISKKPTIPSDLQFATTQPVSSSTTNLNSGIDQFSNVLQIKSSSKSLLNTSEREHKSINNNTNSEVISKQSTIANNSPTQIYSENERISFGEHNTSVSAKVFNSIKWSSVSAATRTLLIAVFGRKILATHSMTGKPSPAFKHLNKPVKDKLNPDAISDIIEVVQYKFKVSAKEVRNIITTKCADETKMMKLRVKKRALRSNKNKENMSP